MSEAADMAGRMPASVPGAPPRRLAVVGTGLVGTSIGLAVRAAAPSIDVLLVDPSDAAVSLAAARGAGRPWDGAEVELTFLTCPPSAVARCLEEWLPLSQTVSDVAGVKAHARLDIQPPSRYVGGHPMAGSHHRGGSAARADLFRGRTWALCVEGSDPDAIASVEAVVRLCGARPVRLSAQAHDTAVALLSHLPQVVASALAAQLADVDPDAAQLAGPGVRDTTRVAASPAELWTDLLPRSADVLAPVVRAVGRRLLEVADALADPDAVEQLLLAGQRGVAALPGRHSSVEAPADEVVTEIDDSPGALATITAIAARAEVNIDDLRVEHVLGTRAGSLRLSVPAGQGPRLRDALQAEGRAAGLVPAAPG